jgi:hypothetical protein
MTMLKTLLLYAALLVTAVLSASHKRAPVTVRNEDVIVTAIHTGLLGLAAGTATAALMYFWPKLHDSEARRIQRLKQKRKAGGTPHKADCPCCQ